MKHTLLYIATTLLLASCGQEELPLGEQALGYLSLSAIEVEASDVQLISTRAGETDDLIVALTPAGEETAKEYEYAETISCPPGTYTLEIYNQAYKDKADAAQHYYKHREQVVIEEGKTTTIEEQEQEQDQEQPIQVPMINFGVQLQLPDEFDTWFPTSTFTVNGKPLKDGETVYFDYSSDAKIKYKLTATNADDETKTDEVTYNEPITSGTIYVITYSLATKSLQVEK